VVSSRPDDQSTADGSVVLLLRDVTKTFRSGEVETRVLRGISLEIRTGEITVIVGASGSGKTTLLNVAGGMLRPTAGHVTFGGRDLAACSDQQLTRFRRDELGFVFQFYNLVPTLTAVENVRVATQIAADPLDPFESLRQVDLSDRADHFPSQLSGGEQQRVAIARAIAKRPAILFCDEPTGALDVQTGKVVLATLARLNEAAGTTMVIVTHNLALAGLAHRVVRIGSGVIEQVYANAERRPVEELSW
jgi:putative ABC transport system ATP-binding protein